MSEDKTLPKDSDSDFSLPGRFEEANSNYFRDYATEENFSIEQKASKTKNKTFTIIAIVFIAVSVGVFSYYFSNQAEIDSQIVQNTYNLSPEEELALQYGVGEFGSDHAHAAIAVFIGEEKINFARPQYQLTSQYIHFENHNPYLIHRHATDVPLEMLFSSFGMKVASDCIIVNVHGSNPGRYCIDEENSLSFYVNGQSIQNISQYVPQHNDRIMIAYGDVSTIPEKLIYLDTLRIPDVPKKTPQLSKDEILI